MFCVCVCVWVCFFFAEKSFCIETKKAQIQKIFLIGTFILELLNLKCSEYYSILLFEHKRSNLLI